jgi:hypothetical protein
MSANSKEVQGKRKTPSLLDTVLEHRLLLYALAAGAAVAGTPSAQAKAVYTPSNAILTLGGKPLQIDLNNDGVNDFVLRDQCISYTSCFGGADMSAQGYGVNIVARENSRDWAVAFKPRQKIGPADTFERYGQMLAGYSFFGGRTSSYGPFAHTTYRALGVKFVIKGQEHYGWIGFRSVDNFTAKLVGWAYEDKPNTPILAGQGVPPQDDANFAEPTSLELLAGGHVAMADWRRRKAAA